jgi:hypothetical protein
MNLPGTPAWRRRVALGFLGLGAVLAVRALSRDLPREQTLIFRPSETLRRVPLTLHVSVTRVGESEARAGLSVTRSGSEASDPRQTLRVPDGDYVVTLDWTLKDDDSNRAPKENETSRVERVTLTGGETIVPLAPRATE